MLRCRTLFLFLVLLSLAAAAPASATPVTVLITGTWDTVEDTAGVTDGSIVVGGSFTATLVYDDTATDLDPDPNNGGYVFPAGSSDFTLDTGNFSFVPGSDLVIAIENDNGFGEDQIFLFAEDYSGTGPFAAGTGIGGTAFANPLLTDTTATALSTDDLTGVVWTIGSYDLTNFYFFAGVTGASPGDFIELSGTITGLSILPEPSTLLLGLVGALGLAAARLRG
jgi:hypothetical protein